MRLFDFIVVIVAAALVGVSAIFIYGGDNEVVCVSAGAENWVFPVSANEVVAADGPLGSTVVEIKDGRVRILSSPCLNKLCVAMGAIDSSGEFVACLPNRVIVTIEGAKNKDKIDGGTW